MTWHRAFVRGLMGLQLLLLAGGCASSSPERPEIEKPEKIYSGLIAEPGQTAAIMVWADWRTRNEYATLQIDLARLVQQKLLPPPEEGEGKDKAKEKEKKEAAPQLQFVNPASVLKYQRAHPETETMPITEVAPKLGVSRLIFVEIETFDAQSPESILVLKGIAKVNLRVVEVANRQGTVVFEETGITAHYPPDAPEGVVASDKVNIRTIYNGTLGLLADKLAARFDVKN